jgi:hypothetical protein
MNIFLNTCLSTIASVGAYGIFYEYSDAKSIQLQEALSTGRVILVAKGTGTYNGESVSLSLRNKSAAELNVIIPRGTLFKPNDNGEQTLITMEDQIVLLESGGKVLKTINAYCSENKDKSPGVKTTFSVDRNKNPLFDSLFVYLKSKSEKIPNKACQDIVWALSDNLPISNISNESKTLKSIRKFLFKLTKQEEFSYTIQMYRSLDQNGYIKEIPINLVGYVELSSEKDKWIYQAVYDEKGKLRYKSNQAFPISKGISDYTFHLGIKGWAKGHYTLKLKNGSEIIQNYPFII